MRDLIQTEPKDLKPIPTLYRGCRFLSRLEARWAVYFDALGIEWDYEREGFDLPSIGAYLPDFWLSKVQMWAEVKPALFDEAALRKATGLASATGHEVLLLVGPPDLKAYGSLLPDGNQQCYVIGNSFLETPGRFYSVLDDWPFDRGIDVTTKAPLYKSFLWFGYESNLVLACDGSVNAAVYSARSARFGEHGEVTRHVVKMSDTWE